MSRNNAGERVLASCDGGDGGGRGEGTSILALSGGGGDKKLPLALAVLGVSLVGALAFAYTRPEDNKW